ncbi:uncharacterized protein TNIN_2811 [Trichonephila inaurata madagascariensis]|uniref:Uncharacterized protein n=1 Tax=Trichonephila inaurata madagascariensis TaxID=2747483 RepID=A0A8X6Y9T9_9ARAC|nr:uncharacterized protein TNIN_2811 [Trichonephila inaurata madagascariensis]
MSEKVKVRKKKKYQKPKNTSTPISKTVSDNLPLSFKQLSMIKPNNRNKKYMNSFYPFFGVKKPTKIKGFTNSIHQSSSEISESESSKEIQRKESSSFSNLFKRNTCTLCDTLALKTLGSSFRKWNRISNISPIFPKPCFCGERISNLRNSSFNYVDKNAVPLKTYRNENSQSFEYPRTSSATSLKEANKNLSSLRHSIRSRKIRIRENVNENKISPKNKRTDIKQDFITDYILQENKDTLKVKSPKEILKKIIKKRTVSNDKENIKSYSGMNQVIEHSAQVDKPYAINPETEITSKNKILKDTDLTKEFELHNRDKEKSLNEKSLQNSATHRNLVLKKLKDNQENDALYLKETITIKSVKPLNKKGTRIVCSSAKKKLKIKENIEKEAYDVNSKKKVLPNLRKKGRTLNVNDNKQPNFSVNASRELKMTVGNKPLECKKENSAPLKTNAEKAYTSILETSYVKTLTDNNPDIKKSTLKLKDLTNNKTFFENNTTAKKSNSDSRNNGKENQIKPPLDKSSRKSKRKCLSRSESKQKEGKTTLNKGKLLEETFSYPSTSTPFESPQVETGTMPLIFRSLSPVVEEQPKTLSTVLYDNEPSVAYANKTYSKYKQSSLSREERLWSLITTVSSGYSFMESFPNSEEVGKCEQEDCTGNIGLFESPPCNTSSKTYEKKIKKNVAKRTFRKRCGSNKKSSFLGGKSKEKRMDIRILSQEKNAVNNETISKQSKLLEHFDEILDWSLCIEKESKKKYFT